jgi:hypothetical protein
LDEENRKCSICFGEFEENENVRFLACFHKFHVECIDAWLAKNEQCPVCKKDLKSLIREIEKLLSQSS